MAGRDPAFLYYDADVALDVAHMNRLEKGCYLDLVQLYRRYDGFTIVQIRMVLGIDFESVWNALELVLLLEEEKYHIQWLRNSLKNKAERNKKNKENIQKRWEKQKENVQSVQNRNTIVLPSNNYCNTAVSPLNDIGNTNVIPIIVTETETKDGLEKDVGGVEGEGGEKEGFMGSSPPEGPDWPQHASGLPAAMVEIFVKSFPQYPRQDGKDFSACLQIAYQIAEMNGWPWQSALNGRMSDVLAKWSEIVSWIPSNSWYRTKSISFLNANFQCLIQEKSNGTAKTASASKSYSGRGPTNGIDPTRIEREGVGDL